MRQSPRLWIALPPAKRSTRVWLSLAIVFGAIGVGSHFLGVQWNRMRYSTSGAPGSIVSGQHDTLTIGDGQVQFVHEITFRLGSPPPDRGCAFEYGTTEPSSWFNLLPAVLGAVAGSMPVEGKDTISTLDVVAIPFAMPIAACLIVPASRGWRARQAARRQRRVGRCHSCDYDLRASPDRCPECGATR